MSLLSEGKRKATELLENYHSVNGVGGDNYSETPQVHPMADGLYIEAICVSLKSRMIASSTAATWISGAVRRLETSRVDFAEGSGWGLGFAHGGAGPNEPYVITTAIIARALRMLNECEWILPRTMRLHNGELYLQALDALEEWLRMGSEGGGGLEGVPHYSPNTRLRVFNPIALAISELQKSERDSKSYISESFNCYLELIDSSYVNGIGWPYARGSATVDLMHQSFMIDALQVRGMHSEQKMLDTALLFGTPFGYLDSAKLLDSGEDSSLNFRLVYQQGGRRVIRPEKLARTWSLAAWLRTIANHMPVGVSDSEEHWNTVWRLTAMDVLRIILSRLDDPATVERNYPRQYIYVALSIMTLVARTRASTGTGQG